MNRRSEKLDLFLGKLVDVTFTDGDTRTGVLEFGMTTTPGLPPANDYTIYVFGEGYTHFRKSTVKSIKEHK